MSRAERMDRLFSPFVPQVVWGVFAHGYPEPVGARHGSEAFGNYQIPQRIKK